MKQDKMRKLKVGLLGFGGMGHFHAAQYQKQKNCSLVAICDINRDTFENDSAQINIGSSGSTKKLSYKPYFDYEDMIRNEKLDFLDICLPCHLHAEYAMRGMRDGLHVLCEKPMARTSALANEMIRVSKETGKKLMIAQCLRFEQNFKAVHDAVKEKKYGKLLRLDMRRNSTTPKNAWYHDGNCSGGALLDLHLHDTDFINWTFGVPDAVRTCGVTLFTGCADDLMTTYLYKNGPVINSEGSWRRAKWTTSTVAVFEKATLELDGNKLLLSRVDQPLETIELPESDNGYFAEIAYFASCILEDKPVEICSPESTRDSIRIAEAEQKSACKGKKIKL